MCTSCCCLAHSGTYTASAAAEGGGWPLHPTHTWPTNVRASMWPTACVVWAARYMGAGVRPLLLLRAGLRVLLLLPRC